jgi:hypothetical protein
LSQAATRIRNLAVAGPRPVLLRGRSKRGAAEKPGGSVARDVIEVSDDEDEGVIKVDASSKGGSPEQEAAGVVAVPTPPKRAVRAVTGESEDGGDADGGGGRSSSGGNNSVGVGGLEDDDVLVPFLKYYWCVLCLLVFSSISEVLLVQWYLIFVSCYCRFIARFIMQIELRITRYYDKISCHESMVS